MRILNKMKQQTQTKQLPKGWKKIPLSEVLDYEQPNGYIVNSEILVEKTPIPVLTANKGFIKGYTKETGGIYRNIPVIIFDDFTADNKFVNFPFKVKSSAMKILKIKDKNAHLKYIFYQMQLRQVDTGTHKRYYLSSYQKLNFIFPIDKDNKINLPEQTLIVSAIETQFSRLEEAVKVLKSVKDKLRVYRKAVLKNAFEKKEGWEEKKIKDICKLINGRAFKPSEWVGKGLPIIRIQNLNNEEAQFNYCDFEIDKRFYIDNGNLLFAWSGTPGTSFGAHIWKRGRAVLNQHIFKVEVNEKEINELFFMHLLNKNVQEYIQKAHGTAGLAHITKGKFEEAKISFPNPSEQFQIVQSIESKFSVIDKVEGIVNQSLIKAEKLRKSILKSAFEGKLVKGEEK